MEHATVSVNEIDSVAIFPLTSEKLTKHVDTAKLFATLAEKWQSSRSDESALVGVCCKKFCGRFKLMPAKLCQLQTLCQSHFFFKSFFQSHLKLCNALPRQRTRQPCSLDEKFSCVSFNHIQFFFPFDFVFFFFSTAQKEFQFLSIAKTLDK